MKCNREEALEKAYGLAGNELKILKFWKETVKNPHCFRISRLELMKKLSLPRNSIDRAIKNIQSAHIIRKIEEGRVSHTEWLLTIDIVWFFSYIDEETIRSDFLRYLEETGKKHTNLAPLINIAPRSLRMFLFYSQSPTGRTLSRIRDYLNKQQKPRGLIRGLKIQ